MRAATIYPDVWHVVKGHPFILRFMGAGVRRPNKPVPGIDRAGGVGVFAVMIARAEIQGKIVVVVR